MKKERFTKQDRADLKRLTSMIEAARQSATRTSKADISPTSADLKNGWGEGQETAMNHLYE